MRFLEKFNRIFRTSGEGRDPLFYTMPQTYEVRYEALITNTAGEVNSFYVILPVPPKTPYQKILREPQFFPKKVSFGQDSVFRNKYAYWQAELAPNESKIFKEEFTVAVSPRKDNIMSCEDLILSGYNLTRLNLVRFRNAYVNAEDERIRRIVKEVVGGERKVFEVLHRLNEYVIKHLYYGNPIKGLYSAKDALEKPRVDCGGFDTLLAALCLAVGIPAQVVSGFWAGYDKNDMHSWVEVLLPGTGWIPADPSVEHLRRLGRTKKSGGLGFVGSDRIVLSIGCDIPIKIGEKNIRADILQNPIIVPLSGSDSFSVETEFATSFV
jgi:transglutaminase-like putative cysteine protease